MYTLRINTRDSKLIIRKKTAKIKVGASVKRGLKGDPGTTDYNELTNLPDLTLKADKTYVDAQDAALQDAIDTKQPAGDYATNTALANYSKIEDDTTFLESAVVGNMIPNRMDSLLVKDSFARPDTTSGVGWSDSGSYWQGSSDFYIEDGRLAISPGNSRQYIFATSFERNVRVSAKLLTPESGSADVGLWLRTNANLSSLSGYHVKFRSSSPSSGTLSIASRTNGVVKDPMSPTVEYVLPYGTFVDVEATIEDDTITILVDNAQILTYTLTEADKLAAVNSTDHGVTVHTSFGNEVKFIDFQVEALKPIKTRRFARSIAHRGRIADMPENSINSLYALPFGIDGVEIDTQQTADGHIVLMHDADISRTTNGTGEVSSYTLAELRQFSIDNNGGTIPTLEEYLEACAKRPDIKEILIDYVLGSIPDTITVCENSPVADKCYIFMGSVGHCATVRAASPTIKLVLGSTTSSNVASHIQAVSDYNIDYLLMSHITSAAQDTATMQQITSAGIELGLSLSTLSSHWAYNAKQVGVNTLLSDWAHLPNSGLYEETASSRYYEKSEAISALALKANADATVNLTGNQTIAGVKTFTSAPIAPSGTSIGGVLHLTGVGQPNGVVSAPVGSTYIDTAVTNGASSWIKKSGTGNTGWVVLEGDTGWRNISTLVAGYVSGSLRIKRSGDVVSLMFVDLDLGDTSGATNFVTGADIQGFRFQSYSANFQLGTGSSTTTRLQVSPDWLRLAPAVSGIKYNGYFEYNTTQPYPTTLPGTPA